jgi:effector-binding domain-containing protein
MAYEVQVIEVAPRRLASIAGHAPFNNLAPTIMELLDGVWAFLRANNVTATGHNVIQYGATGLKEVGVEVSGEIPAGERVKASSTPAGRVATTVHWGSYDGLGAASRTVVDWCAANGHQLSGESWEVYGDWSDNPSKLRTDVFFLLAPAAGDAR